MCENEEINGKCTNLRIGQVIYSQTSAASHILIGTIIVGNLSWTQRRRLLVYFYR